MSVGELDGRIANIQARLDRQDELIRRFRLGLPSPVDDLKDAYVKGRIELDEFERRVGDWL